jgi:hypothetical protein
MPKIKYIDKRFNRSSRELIDRANAIVEDYQRDGYDLTLRQLYYQFVARGWIANEEKEYKRLGAIITDARLAGLIDWEAITDRTRNLRSNPHWASPAALVESAAGWFALDKWADQPNRPEVWIEKDALVGILEQVCEPLDVAYFSCRGYTSASEVWAAAGRLDRYIRRGQHPIVIHLGDHDPSGIDMSRDIQDRFKTFGVDVEFRRLALNMDQVRTHRPPPNPAKKTDARFESYQELYGDESWELDALDPITLTGLIRDAVLSVRDDRRWSRAVAREAKAKAQLTRVAEHWESVVDGL